MTTAQTAHRRIWRIVGAAAFVRSLGLSAALTLIPLFFANERGLDPVVLGGGLATAGLLTVVSSFPAGRWCDERGPRTLVVVSSAAGAISFLPLTLPAPGPVAFLLSQVGIGLAIGGMSVGESTLIGRITEGADRVRLRAFHRAASNGGAAIGAVAILPALSIGDAWIYQATFGLSAVLLVASVYITRMLPSPEGHGAGRSRFVTMITPLRNHRFVLLVLGSTWLMVRNSILTVGVPLWLVSHTYAPVWVISAVLIVNTCIVIGGQVWASGMSATPKTAVRSNFVGAAALASGCAVFGLTNSTIAPAAVVGLFVLAACIFTIGEMLCAAAAWTLSYEVAEPGQLGMYQGTFAAGLGLSEFFGPVIAVAVAVSGESFGWLLVGFSFLAASTLAAPLRKLGPAGTVVR